MSADKEYNFNDLLVKYIDEDFRVAACGVNRPSEGDIARFEQKIGYKLPEDFREFSKSSYGGIYVDAKPEVWQRAKPYDVGPFWSFLYGVFVYGFADNVPEWLDITLGADEFQKNTQSKYTPFLKVIGDADVYCFNSKGNTFKWNHETGEFNETSKSFLEILDYELSQLKERKERKKSEKSN